jgi:hypothetical protein
VLVRIWRKGNSCALLVEMQISIAIMENIMECYDNMDELEIIVK